jgi:isoleucyl-tRNA synthetase
MLSLLAPPPRYKRPAMFKKVPSELDFPKEEREILEFWKTGGIFQKSLEPQAPGAPTFVFYEGPPTANGLPHNGHVLTRVIKDLFPRYKTMRGFSVPRKAGWDTHGLPVEVEVEKELRIHGKAAIEQYGVEPFVKKCVESVFRYTEEWERLTERIGFWVDLKDAYVTYHKSYVESVWWALSELHRKGLLYRGHKVVWWWAQGGTALSSGEVGLGYREVDDPSVYVAFPLEGEANLSLLVWTTTPWTLPSNMYAAVHPEFSYAVVEYAGKTLVVAEKLVGEIGKKLKCDLKVERTLRGRDLVGKRYSPPFDLFAVDARGPIFTIVPADFVTLDAGTGIVHIAPAFGEDDHEVHKRLLQQHPGLPLFCAIEPDGTFIRPFTPYRGRWIKDCDKDIAHDLKERGLLVHQETYRHDYPFCWRADSDPLIQYARPAWYIKTTALIDSAIANNRAVNWLPEHIKEGRFGDFLAHNVDWALSRERYWGTPLNIWICDQTPEHKRAPSSVTEIQKLGGSFAKFEEARKKDPSLSEHLIVHKPWIDEVTFPCAECKGTMRRVPDVIDCWFDSGCMPFAQWGYPHRGEAEFERSFPADFISEAIDQTRGWFYSLLMISTLLFEDKKKPHPFKTCIVLGHVSDKEGKKESKSKGNYTPPEIILDEVKMDFAVTGADAPVGQALIAREDLEGLDLQEGATLEIRRGEKRASCTVRADKKLPRRVISLDPRVKQALGVRAVASRNVKPVEVPRLPEEERVTIADKGGAGAPGADAFRWFFYASNPPWSATRHSLGNVRALQKELPLKLRNVYSFFVIYANIDGEVPRGMTSALSQLDRWILSELAITVARVTQSLDAYDVYGATQRLTDFVDALSNWYVRRSRERFWRSGWDSDKAGAHYTLYEVLAKTTLLIAPFLPFQAESIYQNLVAENFARKGVSAAPSVHLARWPEADRGAVDEQLSAKMRAARDVVSVGLQVRTHHKLKVRQPLRRAHVILNDAAIRGTLHDLESMIKDELNVLELDFVTHEEAARFGTYAYKPNFRSLGQRGLGKQAQELKQRWAKLSAEDRALLDRIVLEGKGSWQGIDLMREDVEAFFETKEGFAAAGDRVGVVVLETRLDDELREMGFARELQNRVQTARKERGLEYTDRIRLEVRGGDRTRRVLEKYGRLIAKECLVVESSDVITVSDPLEVDVEGEKVSLGITKA